MHLACIIYIPRRNYHNDYGNYQNLFCYLDDLSIQTSTACTQKLDIYGFVYFWCIHVFCMFFICILFANYNKNKKCCQNYWNIYIVILSRYSYFDCSSNKYVIIHFEYSFSHLNRIGNRFMYTFLYNSIYQHVKYELLAYILYSVKQINITMRGFKTVSA